MNELETTETSTLPETFDNDSPMFDISESGLSHETTPSPDVMQSGYDVDFEDDYDDDDDDYYDEDVSRTRYMQNRELSWLTFNERVLDQGADESVPLLQRLNFISIFWSNLQEFFMVRVGSLTDLSFIEPPVQDNKTGMTPKEQIRAIHDRCSELYPIQESYYEHVRGSLAKEGVRHLRPEDISDEQRNYLFGLVKHNIEPFLSPQIINSRHPFPHLENGKLYILVRLDDEADKEERKRRKKEKGKRKEKGRSSAEGVLLGLIPLPHQCERVIKLPGRGFQFILLEHAIEMFVPEIFSMYKIKHTNVICVTRNADIDANQGFDEQDEDYREHMKRLLKQRARLAPVRLECERPLSPVMEKLMLSKLGLKRFQVYDTIVPLDLSFTWGLGSRLTDKKEASLSDTPFSPAWPTSFDKKRRIMDQVSEQETLLFYPYESMDPFVQLLREASVDPDVVSIKITLYRLASQSHLAEALIAAAYAGKEVTALFELRARFDENNNIEWSQRFEEAGCNVIYGFRDYKVHSKICCITRRTADGGVQHITQLGTGNYNEKTAKLYTDLSFITTSEEFGRDAVEFFRNMQLEHVSDNYKVLRVAPLQIKPLILDNLDKQIANARAGKPAKAFMKANSITDVDVIEKISEASNAGVDITLFIRGICCLLPDIIGATENVRVVSIVGRLLEHSRIYCFGEGDDCVVYLSSADLMTRNLNKRVEIAWPVLNPELRDRILMYIEICMSDTAKLRKLRPNATYTPLGAFCEIDEEGNSKPAFDAQDTLINQAAEAARIMSEMEEAAEAEAAKLAALAEAETEAEAEAESDSVSEPVEEIVESADKAPESIDAEAATEETPLNTEESLMEEPAAEPAAIVEPENEPVAIDEPETESAVEPLITSDEELTEDSETSSETDIQAVSESAYSPAIDSMLQAALELTPEVNPEEAATQEPETTSEASDSITETSEARENDEVAVAPETTEVAEVDKGAEAVEVTEVTEVDDSSEVAEVAGVNEAAEASETAEEASSVDSSAPEIEQAKQDEPIDSSIESSIPEASERVAELIDQLGASAGQKPTSAREPLTDMLVDDIVSSIKTASDESLVEETPSTTTQQEEQKPVETIESLSHELEKQQTSEPQNPEEEDYKKAPDGAVEEFFGNEAREIEVPKKKKGFWARLFS